MMRKFVTFIFLFLFAVQLYGEGALEKLSSSRAAYRPPLITSPFLAPNEIDPVRAKPIWEQASGGVYVSVGTERGFIGAGANPETTHLLLVDADPAVVFYNRVNIALLKISRSREEFIFLRRNATPQDWTYRATALNLDKATRKLLLDQETWSWWQAATNSKIEFQKGFYGMTFDPHDSALKGVNYLLYDEQFKRVKLMAQLDRIHTIGGNFNDQSFVKKLVASLSQDGLRLGVLDVSNA